MQVQTTDLIKAMQALQQAAQAVQQASAPSFTSKDKWTLAVTALFTIFAAIGASSLTLWRQRRNQKFDAKLNLFITLMMHRKANPPNQSWVNGLNIIDVIFYDAPKVLEAWHKLFDILNDKNKVGSNEHTRQYITLLTEMATTLRYKSLKWTEIDKFYSPQIYAEQAQINAQMQGDLLSFFQTATATLQKQLAPKPAEEEAQPQAQAQLTPSNPPIAVEIISPEDNERVYMNRQVSGYVLPSGAGVQVLVFSRDNLWHPQTPILRNRTKWQVNAVFGNPESDGYSYKVIAIISATEIKTPVKDLPEDAVRSEVVMVTRHAGPVQAPRATSR